MKKISITCISDLHGFQPKLDGGDLLIVAGDLTARDTFYQHEQFKEWLLSQDYKRKILIAGNHDGHIQRRDLPVYDDGIDYLEDSGTEFEDLKIWGSPWTNTFYNWHFMLDPGEPIKEKWDLIPDDTDILITHGPPFGILDKVTGRSIEQLAGCEELRKAVSRVKPKLHVFGHIHSQGGKTIDLTTTTFVNAAIMDEDYQPVNKPVRIIL